MHSGVAILGILNLGGLPKFHTYEMSNILFIVPPPQKKKVNLMPICPLIGTRLIYENIFSFT